MPLITTPRRLLAALALFALALTPASALACACGCNIFDVGADQMVAPNQKLSLSLEDDYLDQSHNWSGTSGSPSADNPDKEIRSDFVTLSAQYVINSDWSVSAQIPYWTRQFRTLNNAGTTVDTFNHSALGDIRIMAQYSGFAPDRSTGITFGVKTASGDSSYANFDRDTEIGSGSTDLLLGGYHAGSITEDSRATYFVRALWDAPVTWRGGYRPGQEVAGALGGRYLAVEQGKVRVAVVMQVLAQVRAKDTGPAADPVGSGYERVLAAPGLELDSGSWKLYGDIELPVYQRINGNQLTAPGLFKLVMTRGF